MKEIDLDEAVDYLLMDGDLDEMMASFRTGEIAFEERYIFSKIITKFFQYLDEIKNAEHEDDDRIALI